MILAELDGKASGFLHGAQFATIIDPDGNYIQVIELNAAYLAAHQQAR